MDNFNMLKRITVLVFLAAAALPSGLWAQKPVVVTYDDDRAPESLQAWKLPTDGESLYFRANDVARLFRATQFWNATSRKVVLGVGRTRFILTVDTRVVVIDGEPVMLRTPIKYDSGFVMVPLEFILEVASHYTPWTFNWDPDSRELSVRGFGYNIERLVFSTAADRTTATITLSEPLLYHMDANTPGLVRLKLYGGRVDTRTVAQREPRGLIEGVRSEQTERDAFIYFAIKRTTTRLRIEREESPDRIVLVLEKGDLPEIPDAEFEGTRIIEIVDETTAERRTIDVKTVVIDPGHGGKDHGKAGKSGLLEKDVNLMLAEAMRDRIERVLGLEVILTREDDRLLSLTHRTEIANEAGGDLFVSIHCNSWFSERSGGFEAYFLSPARSESERALARYENTAGNAASNTPDGDIDFIIWDLVQNEYINESSTFAEFVQKEMSDRLSVRNRGVKQANFVVLQGARMPAVLIETAFLSNPTEEALLADPDFHRQLADGMVDAIRSMQKRYR
jgi:N-acetylmuramoyl-L-alanine amidase